MAAGRSLLCKWTIGLCLALKVMSEEIPEECKAIMNPGKELCCDMIDDSETDEEKNIYNQCLKNVAGEGASTNLSSAVNVTVEECIEECFFNASGVLYPNMTMIPDKLKEEIIRGMNQSDVWLPVIVTSLTKCIEQAPKMLSPNSKCTSGSYQLQLCLAEEAYMNCPASKWTNTDECKKEKSVMKKCAKYVFM